MKTHIAVAILLFALTSALCSCASIVRGSSEKLIIQSTPSGAEVRLSTGHSGITPYEVDVKRKDTIFVTITKTGYKPLETAVISSIDGGSLGIGTAANLLFLPIVNDIVDYKTGANYSHKPNPLIVTLIPLDSPKEYQLTDPSTPPQEPTSEEPHEEPKLTPTSTSKRIE